MRHHYRTYGLWLYPELHCIIKSSNKKKFHSLDTPNCGTFRVKINSTRLRCFKRSPQCVYCDRAGTIWMLQSQLLHRTRIRTNEEWRTFHSPIEIISVVPPHLNLYSHDDAEGFVMMTQDHNIPSSLGGSDNMRNLQTCCEICNAKKGCQLPFMMEEEK